MSDACRLNIAVNMQTITEAFRDLYLLRHSLDGKQGAGIHSIALKQPKCSRGKREHWGVSVNYKIF